MADAATTRTKGNGQAGPPRYTAFDAGKTHRRLRGVPTATQSINTQIRSYGKNVLARSRYLSANNPYAAAAREAFVSALVGKGIQPSVLLRDEPELKDEIQLAWNDWIEEADADNRADFYGIQQIVAAELFDAGEVFIRFRPRLPEDGLTVPLQLQVIPAEMLPLDKNETLDNGRRIEMGVEFDGIGRRRAYHFLKQHPGQRDFFPSVAGVTTPVPADQILHLFRRVRAGQVRGLPHTVASIARLAFLDLYEDAELERKKTAALVAAFVTRPLADTNEHPFASAETPAPDATLSDASLQEARTSDGGFQPPEYSWAFEPGAIVDLETGEDVKFSDPADVGGNFEAFEYRNLLAIASGYGVPYAEMTGDLRQTSYGSLRGGMIAFRRRIEAMQHRVMVFQFCRPVWKRWLSDAVLAGAIPGVSASQYRTRRREFNRVKWIPPSWEWIDPLKDRQAEKLAVDAGFKSRSDVIEAEGGDPEDTDARIAGDKERAEKHGLSFSANVRPTSVPTVPRSPGEESSREDEDRDREENEEED